MAAFQSNDPELDTLLHDIGNTLREVADSVNHFTNKLRNKHVVVVMGNTKSGKSTLINYIMGTQLEAYQESRKFKIKKRNIGDAGPAIGVGSVSETALPRLYPLNELGMFIVDCPGFDDNRGEVQDIINSLYLNQINNAKTVKLVLVHDLCDLLLSDNINSFISLLSTIHSMIPNFEDLVDSVSIVFTKDFCNCSPADVADLLRRKILNVQGLDVDTGLVSHFVQHNDLIGIFKMPTVTGVIAQGLDVNINEARLASSSLVLTEQRLKVVLSRKSHEKLFEICNNYLDSQYFETQMRSLVDLCKLFGVVNEVINEHGIDQYVFASVNSELLNIQNKVESVCSVLQEETKKIVINFRDIDASLRNVFPRGLIPSFASSFQDLLSIDQNYLMDAPVRNKFAIQYKKSMVKVSNQCQKLYNTIKKELEDREEYKTNLKAALGASVGGAGIGGISLLARVATATLAGPLGWVAIVGGALFAFGGAAAAATVHTCHQRQCQQLKARRSQNRGGSDDIFNRDYGIP